MMGNRPHAHLGHIFIAAAMGLLVALLLIGWVLPPRLHDFEERIEAWTERIEQLEEQQQ